MELRHVLVLFTRLGTGQTEFWGLVNFSNSKEFYQAVSTELRLFQTDTRYIIYEYTHRQKKV